MVYYCRLEPEISVFNVVFPDVPNAITFGHTVEEALANAKEALDGVLESDIAHGFPLPEAKAHQAAGYYPVEAAPHIIVAWEIRKLRGERTQSEIAAKLGFSYQAYQRLENPSKGNPTIKTLERIARVLGKRLEIRIA